MILPDSFSKDWIEAHRKENKLNPPILEKMIWALYLVECLQTEGLNFIFKGGTSLILLLENFNRLSIDVDIITEETRENLESIINQIPNKYNFTKVELDSKRSYKPGIPKAHYNFYYQSSYHKDGISYIMLDVLFEKNDYSKLLEVDLNCKWISHDGKFTKVKVPSINSILGDKITAFAPNTTGILYNTGKEMEIIKQLYDIGRLFDVISSLEEAKSTFDKVVTKEIAYRNTGINLTDVLNDINSTSLILARRDKQVNKDDQMKFDELTRGIFQFRGNIYGNQFRIENAIESASKAAYLSSKIKVGDLSAPEMFTSAMDISEYLIKDTNYSFLNKLKNMPKNGSLFYWNKTLKLLN